jgi:energy-coupling factor transporter ATP-binding protein EcfA2
VRALLPLEEIGLNRRSHGAALRWMGILYLNPKRVEEAEATLSWWNTIAIGGKIYFHASPYLLLVCALGRWFLISLPGLANSKGLLITPAGWRTQGFWPHVQLLAIGLALGLAFGLAASLASDLHGGLAGGLAVGLAFGLAGDLAGSLAYSVAFGLFFGIASSLARSLAFILAAILTGSFAGGIGGNFAGSLVCAFFYLLGFLRLYYLPLHFFSIWPRVRADLYRFHPLSWDHVCLLPFPGLDRLLLAYVGRDSNAGELEIDRLINKYPSQGMAAVRARTIGVARFAAALQDLARLDEVLARLPVGEEGFLKQIPEIRRGAHAIAAVQVQLDTFYHPDLREAIANLLVKGIEGFERQIVNFHPLLSAEFRKAARQWLEIANRQLDAARAAAGREPQHPVFRAGKPVDRDRDAFVLRTALLGELERQILMATGCPGVLIYGRRRMGKSTLLRNLSGLLPARILVVQISMQRATAFSSQDDLLAQVAGEVSAIVSGLPGPPVGLKGLESFLTAANQRLEAIGSRLLLALDEYEYLDRKIGEGVFTEDLLAVFRESIQTHRNITWAFAGSHSIDELTNAPWTSYLVSARTLEVPPFEPAETRLLLTEPLQRSSLWSGMEKERPRFEPGFWGDGGIERIQAETGGWPHLVQLVAETVIDLLNDTGKNSVEADLLDRALDLSVVRGYNVFSQLMDKESELSGEWEYLCGFRSAEALEPPIEMAVERSLRRRRLVVEEEGRFRLRAPLMARWLRHGP